MEWKENLASAQISLLEVIVVIRPVVLDSSAQKILVCFKTILNKDTCTVTKFYSLGKDLKSATGRKVIIYIIGAVGGSLVLVGGAILTIVSVYLFFKWKTKQRVKNFQKDILYVVTTCLFRNLLWLQYFLHAGLEIQAQLLEMIVLL